MRKIKSEMVFYVTVSDFLYLLQLSLFLGVEWNRQKKQFISYDIQGQLTPFVFTYVMK